MKSLQLPDTPSVSLECRDLLTKLLQKDPQRRLKYEDFFAHSFIKSSTIPLPHPSQKEDDNIFERAKGMNSLICKNEAATLYHQACAIFSNLVED